MKKFTTKILLAHSSNDLYGASKILINIVGLLINKGYRVYLFLPEKGPLLENNIIKKCNIEIVEFGVFRKQYFNFFGLINRFYHVVRSTLVIRRFILKNKIDLVYTNTSTLISPTIASKISGIPSIFHIHEIPVSSKLYTRFLVTFFNIFSSKLISVSDAVSNYWIDNGLLKEKIIKIYNGFNFNFSDKKKLDSSKLIFTNISRIIPYKGHLFLIKLFNEILKSNKNIILQIAGDTLPVYENYFNLIKSTVKKFEIEDNVIFLGYRNDVKLVLSKSHFFIHTPVTPDPFPTVLFEAIESCTPVICTNNGGAIEILNDGKNGLFIDHNDLEKSKNKILNYINNYKMQKEHINKSIDYISSNYNYDKFEKNILKVISDHE